jgi:hypothetical protein
MRTVLTTFALAVFALVGSAFADKKVGTMPLPKVYFSQAVHVDSKKNLEKFLCVRVVCLDGQPPGSGSSDSKSWIEGMAHHFLTNYSLSCHPFGTVVEIEVHSQLPMSSEKEGASSKKEADPPELVFSGMLPQTSPPLPREEGYTQCFPLEEVKNVRILKKRPPIK